MFSAEKFCLVEHITNIEFTQGNRELWCAIILYSSIELRSGNAVHVNRPCNSSISTFFKWKSQPSPIFIVSLENIGCCNDIFLQLLYCVWRRGIAVEKKKEATRSLHSILFALAVRFLYNKSFFCSFFSGTTSYCVKRHQHPTRCNPTRLVTQQLSCVTLPFC